MPTPLGRRIGLVLGAFYGIAMLAVGLWPSHIDRNIDVLTFWPGSWMLDHGYTPDQTYRFVESASNVLLYLPFGIIAILILGRLRWAVAVGAGIVVSGSIELVQALGLAGRTASMRDVITNSSGAALGVAIALACGWLYRRWRTRP